MRILHVSDRLSARGGAQVRPLSVLRMTRMSKSYPSPSRFDEESAVIIHTPVPSVAIFACIKEAPNAES